MCDIALEQNEVVHMVRTDTSLSTSKHYCDGCTEFLNNYEIQYRIGAVTVRYNK